MASPTLYARFCKYRRVGDGCWEWTGTRRRSGYGELANGTAPHYGERLAHRLAWFFSFGPIPDGLFVAHSCDNKGCVRPQHLYLATPEQNSRDAAAHRLYPTGDAHHARRNPEQLARGTRNGQAKLTEGQVRAIREHAGRGTTHRFLASLYGVSDTTIGLVVRRETWAHLSSD